MFNKALSLAADSLILDLEDSVTPQNKDSARVEVCEWLCSADFGGREKLVRIESDRFCMGAKRLRGNYCL